MVEINKCVDCGKEILDINKRRCTECSKKTKKKKHLSNIEISFKTQKTLSPIKISFSQSIVKIDRELNKLSLLKEKFIINPFSEKILDSKMEKIVDFRGKIIENLNKLERNLFS